MLRRKNLPAFWNYHGRKRCVASSPTRNASVARRTTLLNHSADYTIANETDGLCYLKVIIAKAHVDTIATVNALRTSLSNLDNKMIEWSLHITKDLGTHDMIIGPDILELLGVNMHFSDQTVQWGTKCMPF